jgi:exopolysaccharide biosynthesis polyprenyl glycosylphosphotransferase
VVQAAFVPFKPRQLAVDALMLLGLLCWSCLTSAYGLYKREEADHGRSTTEDIPALVLLVTLATWLGTLALAATHVAHPRLGIAAGFWVFAILFITCARAVTRSVISRCLSRRESVLIIGAGRIGGRVAQKLANRPGFGLEIVGFLDDDPLDIPEDGPPHLGGTSKLEHVIRAYEIERVIMAFSRLPDETYVDLSRRCLDLGVRVDVVPRLYELIGSHNHVHELVGLPLVELRPLSFSPHSRVLKRAFDLALTGIALAVLAPVLLFCAWRIKATSSGPVFFRQERMGAGGKRFRIYKFRTMYADADQRKGEVEHLNKHRESGPKMFKIPDDPRITPFGKFLRSWSLDELPQLINVLRGQMSLVGPRPLILDEDEHIVGDIRRRLTLTPGITGLWQVLGRSDIAFSEMVTLDYVYVANWSLWGDAKLLAQTVPAVLGKRGAY